MSAATASASAVSVSITDGTATARPGDRLGYQAIVANHGSTDLQLLLEITLPPGAKVADVGGGTTRNAVIDFALTVLGPGRVIERFAIIAGPASGDRPRLDTVASVYVLGGASGAGAEAQATDSDPMAASGIDATSVSQAAGADADSPSVAGRATDQSASPAHEGLWVGVLVLGVLLVIGGLALALWRGSDERELEPERSHRAPSSRLSAPAVAVAGSPGRHGHGRGASLDAGRVRSVIAVGSPAPGPTRGGRRRAGGHGGHNGHSGQHATSGVSASRAASGEPAGWARPDGLDHFDWDHRGRPPELFELPNSSDRGDSGALRPPAEVYHVDRYPAER